MYSVTAAYVLEFIFLFFLHFDLVTVRCCQFCRWRVEKCCGLLIDRLVGWLLQWPSRHRMFVFYRVLVAAYAVGITVMSILLHDDLLPWPTWLTNWSYLLLTCHLLCAAVVVLLNTCFEHHHYVTPLMTSPIPCYMKLSWFLFSVATPAALIVSTVFFAGVFPRLHRDHLNVVDINMHVMNTVLVILEFTLSAFPVRLLHAVYVFLYGLVYVIFSVIYWAFDHSNVMYPGVLDWNAPATTAVVLVVLTFVGIPLLQLFLFGVYQLRRYVCTCCVQLQWLQ